MIDGRAINLLKELAQNLLSPWLKFRQRFKLKNIYHFYRNYLSI